ncbi:hypothetical protein [Sphaerospermopsis torques-reginae]|uniref:Uncharacterized protein n=1 Tax=Sphaerospermopsis torques-reginae ITEP-024 TaxID=984208 RepID=A0ABX8WXQ1_9CYAN|nr:hypothetical protein [Sphaerospermopsis torques-reginae]QYX31147.1 hypothetical protein K2F26_20240 [Sphaerospermopsis torques-reginae ITEP-024]
MYILNESSIAHTFCEPTAITAYIGSLSKSYETILHPALAKYLSTIEYELSSKKYLAGLIYVPNYLDELEDNFIRVRCDKHLYAEEDILEKLWIMTKEEPTKAVQVNALVEAFGYEKRIVSSPGYGKFHLTNIRIGSQLRELYTFT